MHWCGDVCKDDAFWIRRTNDTRIRPKMMRDHYNAEHFQCLVERRSECVGVYVYVCVRSKEILKGTTTFDIFQTILGSTTLHFFIRNSGPKY